MRVPLAEVGRRGRLNLTFALQNDRTVLEHTYCEVPFKITRLLHSADARAHLILMQCTAGLFGGDEVECSIRINRGARVLITQQSATKIHPSGDDRPAISRNRVVVESGAELQLLLEPVIPFTDSILHQETRIDVEPGGRLAFWEGFMTGRVGRGERWKFREFASETQLRIDGQLAYLDRFRLRPDGSERSPCVMGGGAYLGTGLCVAELARTFAAELHEAMPQAGIDSPAADLAVARVVSATGPEFHRWRDIFSHRSSLSCRRVYSCKPRIARASEGVAGRLP